MKPLLFFAIVGIAAVPHNLQTELKFTKKLIDNYGPASVKPDGKTPSESLTVSLSFSLYGISVVSKERGILSLTGFLYMTWIDPRLVFPDRHAVDSFEVDAGKIWTPDVDPVVEGRGVSFLSRQAIAVVSPGGKVVWDPYVNIWIPCDIRSTKPTTCCLEFSSWNYDTTGIVLEPGDTQLGLHSYKPTRYVVMNSQATTNLLTYDYFGNQTFSSVKYTFTFSPARNGKPVYTDP